MGRRVASSAGEVVQPVAAMAATRQMHTIAVGNLRNFLKMVDNRGMGTTTVILQSYREVNMTPWVEACLESTRLWARANRYEYRFMGDALLEKVPVWYRDKLAGRTTMMTDLARLVWLRETLSEGVGVAVWLDADTLVFAPDRLRVVLEGSCQFGAERWVQVDAVQKRRVYRNVHNAYMAFRRDSAVLPFLIEVVEDLVRRVDAARVPPQFVGPKLLTSLHNTVGFDVNPAFGAISPLLAEEILQGEVGQGGDESMFAANLCHSLAREYDHERLIARLADYPRGIDLAGLGVQ